MVRLCALLSLLVLLDRPVKASESSFPFAYRDGLLWVEISVEGQREPLSFLLDSGANVSVIDSALAKNLQLPLGRPVKVRGVQSTVDGFWPQRLTARVGEVAVPTELLATDLTALGRACATRLDGLLGADFFRNRIIQIDFSAQLVRILEKLPQPPHSYRLPLEARQDVLLVSGRVNGGKESWFRIDTGCSGHLHWVNTKARERRKVVDEPSVGLTTLSIPQVETTLQLSEVHLSHVPTGIHSKGIFPAEGGLVGNGILTRFARVTFAPQAGFLFLD